MQTHLTLLDKQMLLYSMVMSPRTSKEILLSIVSTVSTGSFCSSKPPIKSTCAQHFGESHGVRNVCFKNSLSTHFKRASPARVFLAACACSQSSRYTSCKQIALAVERRLRKFVCMQDTSDFSKRAGRRRRRRRRMRRKKVYSRRRKRRERKALV